MESAETHPLVGGTVALFSRRAPDKETPNEDACAALCVADDLAVLIVADGLGGHARGDEASRQAVDAVRRSITKHTGDDLRPAILDGFETANSAVREIGNGAGTTLVVVEYRAGVVRSYHVGDSGVLQIGQRGKMKMQTVAHSPVGYAVEAGMMEEADAMYHDERHLVSNFIGSDEMRIEIGAPTKMARRDTLLLTTDGLLDNMMTEEIVEHLRSGPLAKGVDRLTTEAWSRMTAAAPTVLPSKPDDLTLLAFRQV